MAFLTTAQAAERLGLDPSQVRRLILSGRLRARKFGLRSHMIAEADLAKIPPRRKGWPAGKPRKTIENSPEIDPATP